jgi:hypothetical protein
MHREASSARAAVARRNVRNETSNFGPNWAQRVQCAITWRSHPAAPVLDRTLRSARHNEAADLGVKGSRVQISPARLSKLPSQTAISSSGFMGFMIGFTA